MKQNIFTKQFEELTADELLHLMDMISEECDSHICCVNKSETPSGWFAPSMKEIVEACEKRLWRQKDSFRDGFQ